MTLATRPCPQCGQPAAPAKEVPAWSCPDCGCVFRPRNPDRHEDSCPGRGRDEPPASVAGHAGNDRPRMVDLPLARALLTGGAGVCAPGGHSDPQPSVSQVPDALRGAGATPAARAISHGRSVGAAAGPDRAVDDGARLEARNSRCDSLPAGRRGEPPADRSSAEAPAGRSSFVEQIHRLRTVLSSAQQEIADLTGKVERLRALNAQVTESRDQLLDEVARLTAKLAEMERNP